MSGTFRASERLRATLRGFTDETVQACAEYHATGSMEAFDRAVLELIHHHLSPRPPKPLSTYPGSTALVAELGLDSITMVELVFIFEDLFRTKLPQEELRQVVTIDDLRSLLRKYLPAAPRCVTTNSTGTRKGWHSDVSALTASPSPEF